MQFQHRSGGDGVARRSRYKLVNERKEERGPHRGSDDRSQSRETDRIRRKSWAWVIIPSILFLVAILFPHCQTAIEDFHGQLPETIRTLVPLSLMQATIGLFVNMTSTPSPTAITIQRPMAPEKDNVALADLEMNRQMFSVSDLKKCTSWEGVDPKFYEEMIDVTGRELNLTEDVTDAMKLAQHAGKVVNALEKFEQNTAGMFYFGRYQTRKRPNKNMDVAVVLYGFRWTLDAPEIDQETGDIKKFLHSMTTRQKDMYVKSFRSKAVEAFSVICPSELLTVVDKEIRDSAGNDEEDEEDQYTKEQFAHFHEWLEKEAKPAGFEGKM